MNKKLTVISWSMYDFANNIFAMNIISLYFALWVTVDKGGEDILLSWAISASMILTAISSPVLGAISDGLGRRMPFLIFFTLICILFTTLIGVVDHLFWGLLFFGIANYCYQISWVFYNALLPQISGGDQIGRISGYGKAFGYTGAIAGLLLVKPFVAQGGRQAAFAPSALFFLLFSLPCLFLIKDRLPSPQRFSINVNINNAFKKLKQTLTNVKDYSGLFNFLLSAFFALNAVNTVIVFMAVYANKVIGFTDAKVTIFLIICTLVAIAGCFVSGFITDLIGSKRAFTFSLVLWCFTIILASISTSESIFWIVGPLAGVALGSTWVTSRTLVLDLSPGHMAGEAFGLFSLIGYSASVIGPLIWGGVIWGFGFLGVIKYRLALLTLLLFLILGLFILRKVPNKKYS